MTTSTSFSDLLDSFPEVWRPAVGDKLIGFVIGLEITLNQYGEYRIVTVCADKGGDFAFHPYQPVASGELDRLQVRVGDRIGIAYYGPHPVTGSDRFRIVIARDSGSAVTDDSALASNHDQARRPVDDLPW